MQSQRMKAGTHVQRGVRRFKINGRPTSAPRKYESLSFLRKTYGVKISTVALNRLLEKHKIIKKSYTVSTKDYQSLRHYWVILYPQYGTNTTTEYLPEGRTTPLYLSDNFSSLLELLMSKGELI